MKKIIITVDNEKNKIKLLDHLHVGELHGELDFAFSVLTEDVEDAPEDITHDHPFRPLTEGGANEN